MPSVSQHTHRELFAQSVDDENYPYISQRGMLYWTGTAWAKWTGAITIDLGTDSGVHAEDDTHTSGDEGMFALAVRNDALAALATTDGDYAPLQVNASGALYTELSGNLPDTAAGDLAALVAGQLADGHNVTIDNAAAGAAVNIQDGGNTITVDGTVGLSGNLPDTAQGDIALLSSAVKQEDSQHANADKGIPAWAVRNDTLAAIGAHDGDYAPLQVDADGALYASVTATDLDIRDLVNTSDSVEIYGSDDGGTTQRVIKTDAGGAVQVDVESMPSVTIGTFPDNEPFDMAQVAGTATAVNAGVLSAGVQRVTIATDDEVNNLLGTIDADTGAIKLAVEIMDDWDDNDAVNTFAKPYEEHYAVNTGSALVSYQGWAPPGTLTSAAGWRIRQITKDAVTSGDVDILWADGDALFNNIWDNRQALSYT